jgi:hypothetical protein
VVLNPTDHPAGTLAKVTFMPSAPTDQCTVMVNFWNAPHSVNLSALSGFLSGWCSPPEVVEVISP